MYTADRTGCVCAGSSLSRFDSPSSIPSFGFPPPGPGPKEFIASCPRRAAAPQRHRHRCNAAPRVQAHFSKIENRGEAKPTRVKTDFKFKDEIKAKSQHSTHIGLNFFIALAVLWLPEIFSSFSKDIFFRISVFIFSNFSFAQFFSSLLSSLSRYLRLKFQIIRRYLYTIAQPL